MKRPLELRYRLGLVRADARHFGYRRWRPLLRATWWTLARHHIGERCHDCGRPMGLLWHAPQPLWDQLQHRQGGTVCPRCFDAKARAAGHFVVWAPMVTGVRGGDGNSNHWNNETRDWLMMGQPDPDYPERSEHRVWAVVRDALEAAGYHQPPMDYYPPENFKLPSRSNPDAGYHKLDRLARERAGG